MVLRRKLQAKKTSTKATATLRSIGYFSFPTPAWRRGFRLFDLPGELRSRIFELATSRDVIRLIKSRPRRTGTRKCFLDELLVCKQWFRDFSELFISLKCFQFRDAASLTDAARTWPHSTARYVRAISWHVKRTLRFTTYTSLEEVCRMFPNVAYVSMDIDMFLVLPFGLGLQAWEVRLDQATAMQLPGVTPLRGLLSRISIFRLLPDRETLTRATAYLSCMACAHNPSCRRKFGLVAYNWFNLWVHLTSLMDQETRPRCPQGHLLTFECLTQKHVREDLLFSSAYSWSHFSAHELDSTLRY